MSKAQLIANNLKYSFDNRTLFKEVSLSVLPKDRIALIGENGSGKSTLLKILSGNLKPSEGFITINGLIGYYAQTFPNLRNLELTIAEYLIKEDIQLDQIYTTYLRIWLEQLDFDKCIKNLSGGEFTKLIIAIIASQKPEILVLDEPTNNLDQKSIERLKEYIKYFQGGVVFVTHNLDFIENVPNQIWELENQEVVKTISSYQEFQNSKAQLEKNRLDQLSSTNKELKKIQSAIQFEKQRLNKDQIKQSRKLKKGTSGIPKILAGTKKNEAEKSSGKKLNNLKIQLKSLKLEKTNLQKSLNKQVYLDIESPKTKQRLICKINTKIINKDVNLSIYYGDRVSIEGANGSGKTTLCNYIFNLTKENFKVAYLDQKYSIVDLSKSIWENMSEYNKEFGEELLRRYLGNFLFSTQESINQTASHLSGGELARLTFAMVSTGTIDLLILDEPVNNIDLKTLEVIIHGVNNFKGALIVVAHDKSFVEMLAIKKFISL